MNQRMTYIFIWVVIAIFSGNGFADDKNAKKVFPIPVSEMEAVISDWLSNLGIAAKKIHDQTGRITINGRKEDQSWQVIITPQSPLATLVEPIQTKNGHSYHVWDKELLAHIEAYIRKDSDEPEFRHNVPAASQQAVSQIDLAGDSNKIVPETVLRHLESVVCIRARVETKEIQFSGFVVDPEGHIICTAHDLKDLKDITIILFDGREIEGHVIKMDTKRDLVLLKSDLKLDTYVSLKKGRNYLSIGETLYSVGCPLNLKGTVYSGRVSGPPRKVGDLSYWQVSMKIFPGSSGGPVFDENGNLVAVVKGRYRGTDSIGFLIPFETLTAFLNQK